MDSNVMYNIMRAFPLDERATTGFKRAFSTCPGVGLAVDEARAYSNDKYAKRMLQKECLKVWPRSWLYRFGIPCDTELSYFNVTEVPIFDKYAPHLWETDLKIILNLEYETNEVHVQSMQLAHSLPVHKLSMWWKYRKDILEYRIGFGMYLNFVPSAPSQHNAPDGNIYTANVMIAHVDGLRFKVCIETRLEYDCIQNYTVQAGKVEKFFKYNPDNNSIVWDDEAKSIIALPSETNLMFYSSTWEPMYLFYEDGSCMETDDVKQYEHFNTLISKCEIEALLL